MACMHFGTIATRLTRPNTDARSRASLGKAESAWSPLSPILWARVGLPLQEAVAPLQVSFFVQFWNGKNVFATWTT
jgi:hypothetical protein